MGDPVTRVMQKMLVWDIVEGRESPIVYLQNLSSSRNFIKDIQTIDNHAIIIELHRVPQLQSPKRACQLGV